MKWWPRWLEWPEWPGWPIWQGWPIWLGWPDDSRLCRWLTVWYIFCLLPGTLVCAIVSNTLCWSLTTVVTARAWIWLVLAGRAPAYVDPPLAPPTLQPRQVYRDPATRDTDTRHVHVSGCHVSSGTRCRKGFWMLCTLDIFRNLEYWQATSRAIITPSSSPAQHSITKFRFRYRDRWPLVCHGYRPPWSSVLCYAIDT